MRDPAVDKRPASTSEREQRESPGGGKQLVWVMPPDALYSQEGAHISMAELWALVTAARWFVVGVTLGFACIATAYVLLAKSWYRAEVVLIPVSMNAKQGLAGQLGQFSGLASLAGITLGGDTERAEALAVLQSRELTRSFIEEFNLLPVLFASKWDARHGKWRADDPEDWPDIRDGIRYFERGVRHIQDDKKAGVVTLSVEWKDARMAADWANALAERANDRMRQRALRDAQTNVDYLRSELAATNVVTLQSSISRLLEHEMEKLMLARGSTEFAFRLVDRATPPKWRSWPKRAQTVLLSIVLGMIVSVAAVIVRHFARDSRSVAAGTASVPEA